MGKRDGVREETLVPGRWGVLGRRQVIVWARGPLRCFQKENLGRRRAEGQARGTGEQGRERQGTSTAHCSWDHQPPTGMFSHPHLRKPSDPPAQAGPLRTHSESHHTLLLELPSLGLDCACLNNDRSHSHFTGSSLEKDWAGLSPTLSGSGHKRCGQGMFVAGWLGASRERWTEGKKEKERRREKKKKRRKKE